MTSRWLSPTIFNWHALVEAAMRMDVGRFLRPHEFLSHAERRLEQTSDEFARADAVLNLKRAVNSRLKHIEEMYGLSVAFPTGTGVLERLQKVDLARPLLIHQMFELRNDIEHNDAPVPAIQRCRELVDATWYFLRTTDSACSARPMDLLFCPDKTAPRQKGSMFVSLMDLSPGLPSVTMTARVGPSAAFSISNYP